MSPRFCVKGTSPCGSAPEAETNRDNEAGACVQAFSGCSEWRLLFVSVHELLIAVASFAVKQDL